MQVLACSAVALGVVCLAQAQDKAVDPSGTWTWAGGGGRRGGGGGGGGGGRGGRGGGTNVLVLEYKGGALTGKLTPPARGPRRGQQPADAGATPPPAPPAPTPIDIKDGKVTGNTVSFTVAMPGRGGDPVVSTYKGTVADDKITGTITRPDPNGGDPVPQPWTADKQK